MLVLTAVILYDEAANAGYPISDEKKAVFYAAADVRCLFLQLLSKVLMFSTQGRPSPTYPTPRIHKVYSQARH